MNHKNIPEVHVFSFLKYKELSDVWIHTIKRDTFTPTKFSKASQFLDKKKKRVYLIEKLMNKSISCVWNKKHSETKFCNKKQLNSIETFPVKAI